LLIASVIEFGYLTNLATRRQLRPFERSFMVRRALENHDYHRVRYNFHFPGMLTIVG
jgi:hypothetical protein